MLKAWIKRPLVWMYTHVRCFHNLSDNPSVTKRTSWPPTLAHTQQRSFWKTQPTQLRERTLPCEKSVHPHKSDCCADAQAQGRARTVRRGPIAGGKEAVRTVWTTPVHQVLPALVWGIHNHVWRVLLCSYLICKKYIHQKILRSLSPHISYQ